MIRAVKLLDGKYEVRIEDGTGAMLFLRNGEPWPGGQALFQHAGLVAALVDRVADLESALIHEYNEEWDVGDSITDEAKVQFLIDRIPK